MVVLIDDEKWIIGAYIDELEVKATRQYEYKPIHFYFPNQALKFILQNVEKINVIVLDIGLEYGDYNLMPSEPGGIQFYNKIKNDPLLKEIPVIILTVYELHQVAKTIYINPTNNHLLCYINRNQSDRDDIFWKNIDLTIKQKHF